MRRMFDREEFRRWFDEFVPDITESPSNFILQPVDVETDSDKGLEHHFVGLNLSKAWTMAGVADTLDDHSAAEALEESVQRHLDHSLELAFTEDYAGAHWLSSFVLYLLTRNEGGIAPER